MIKPSILYVNAVTVPPVSALASVAMRGGYREEAYPPISGNAFTAGGGMTRLPK